MTLPKNIPVTSHLQNRWDPIELNTYRLKEIANKPEQIKIEYMANYKQFPKSDHKGLLATIKEISPEAHATCHKIYKAMQNFT